MSDSVYRPISDADEESETHATTDQPVASWSDFRKELEDQANVDRSELTPEEGAAEVTRRKQQPDQSAETAFERPIVRLKSKGPAQNLREATQDLAFTRGLQLRDQLLAEGHTEEELQRRSFEMLEAAQRGDPKAEPPDEVKLTDKWGNPEDGPLSADEAAHKIGEWRAEQARQRAAELQELTGELQARQEQAQQPEQQPEQQQQPAQPTEQQQLAHERWRLAQLRQMDGHEAAARMEYDQTVRAVLAEFPGLQTARPTPQHIEELRQKDPARFQRLAQADQALRVRQQRIAAMAQQRSQRDQQQAQASAQQREAFRAQQDNDFERRAEKIVGAERWQQGKSEVQKAARETLKSAGLNDSQITNLWHGSDSVDMHSAVLQEILLKASMWDSAQAKAQQIRQTPLPQVIRPGTANSSRGSGDDVAALRAKMRNSKGSDGIKLGVALLKAQRANRS